MATEREQRLEAALRDWREKAEVKLADAKRRGFSGSEQFHEGMISAYNIALTLVHQQAATPASAPRCPKCESDAKKVRMLVQGHSSEAPLVPCDNDAWHNEPAAPPAVETQLDRIDDRNAQVDAMQSPPSDTATMASEFIHWQQKHHARTDWPGEDLVRLIDQFVLVASRARQSALEQAIQAVHAVRGSGAGYNFDHNQTVKRCEEAIRALGGNAAPSPASDTSLTGIPPSPTSRPLSAEQLWEIAKKHRTVVAGYEFADKFDFAAIAADVTALLGGLR